MSHYEERLENDLQQIRLEVEQLADRVEKAVKDSVHALLTGNAELASATILADGHINRAMRHIDSLCHSFIAVHLPSAGHLRLMSSIFRVNILLERVGDYAVTISREMFQLSITPSGHLARGIELMAEEAGTILHQAIEAFEQGNVELARGTMTMAAQIQTTIEGIFQDLLEQQEQGKEPLSLRDNFAIFVVYHRLERIADQAKNLCEETVFSVTGETKEKKVYRILFVDNDNSCLGPMAVAIASKQFPESGQYSSAGREPASQLQANMVEYMAGRGVDIGTVSPVGLDLTPVELAEFHVIVGLDGAARSGIEHAPYHSVMLHWDIANVPADADAEALETAQRQLAVHIKDLMIELRGGNAA